MTFLTLFTLSFLAATLLPGGSEALLLYDLSLGYDPFLLIFVATIGNTLGSLVNYWIGLKGVDYLITKKYLKAQQMDRADKLFARYGAFSLLLSWVPIIGDPITFIAGVLKYDIKKFLAIVFLAKGIRYGVISLLI
ncbi:MAG: DedA family protein [Epsilonproteobacteria bacterium]|nr:DedA family protein [Campylobacterota bacterium]